MHCFLPWLHVPEQAPPLHALGQSAPLTHAPEASHVCGVRPVHCVVRGAHTPVQAPLTHAWSVHATGAAYCPVALHVWTAFPMHCDVLGEHTPVQVPLTHADAVQSVVTRQAFPEAQPGQPPPQSASVSLPFFT